MLQRVEGGYGYGPPGAALDAIANVLAAGEPPDPGGDLSYEPREFVCLAGSQQPRVTRRYMVYLPCSQRSASTLYSPGRSLYRVGRC